MVLVVVHHDGRKQRFWERHGGSTIFLEAPYKWSKSTEVTWQAGRARQTALCLHVRVYVVRVVCMFLLV